MSEREEARGREEWLRGREGRKGRGRKGEREKKGGTRERKREREKEKCTNLRVAQPMDGEPKRKTQTETTLLRPSEPERVNKAVWTGNRMESDRSAYWSDGFRFFTFPQPFGFFLCSVEIISPWENIREEYDIGNPCNLRQQGEAGLSSHQPKRLQALGKDPRGLAFYTLALIHILNICDLPDSI